VAMRRMILGNFLWPTDVIVDLDDPHQMSGEFAEPHVSTQSTPRILWVKKKRKQLLHIFVCPIFFFFVE